MILEDEKEQSRGGSDGPTLLAPVLRELQETAASKDLTSNPEIDTFSALSSLPDDTTHCVSVVGLTKQDDGLVFGSSRAEIQAG